MVRIGHREKRELTGQTRRLAFAALFALCVIGGLFSAAQLAAGQLEDWQARREYGLLRQHAPNPKVEPPSSASKSRAGVLWREPPSVDAPTAPKEKERQTPEQLLALNLDYVGWICIEGTRIDYPVVQGADNQQYLSVGFSGNPSRSGAIFIDSRCADPLESPLTIVYGHNMRDGSMFSDLDRYLDVEVHAEHPKIVVTAPDGEARSYRAVVARVVGADDTVYSLPDADPAAVRDYWSSIGEGEEMPRLLALSTCTDSGEDTERLLVLAVEE